MRNDRSDNLDLFDHVYFGREHDEVLIAERIKLARCLCGEEYSITLCLNNCFMCINEEKTWTINNYHNV